jgi:hypothetical protein
MGVTPSRQPDIDAQVEHVIIDLTQEFDSLPAEVVEEHVHRHERSFVGARITTYVPVLVRRGARDDLRRLAH